MRVTVKLSTTLRDYVPSYQPEKPMEVETGEDATVASLAEQLGLPLQEIKIVMVNGRQREVDTPMRDGDRVAYFPAVGGG